jgi:hypothetical protein
MILQTPIHRRQPLNQIQLKNKPETQARNLALSLTEADSTREVARNQD